MLGKISQKLQVNNKHPIAEKLRHVSGRHHRRKTDVNFISQVNDSFQQLTYL